MTTSNQSSVFSEYRALIGQKPDLRWSETTIREKIAEHHAYAARFKTEAERAGSARDQEKAQRAARAGARGICAEYGEHINYHNIQGAGDCCLWAAANWANRAIDSFEKSRKKFIESFSGENPFHAIQWMDSMVEETANYRVAKEFERFFDDGHDLKTLQNYFQEELLRKTSYISNSTSIMTNYSERAIIVSTANVYQKLIGRG